MLPYSQHYLDSVENTDKSSAPHNCKLKTNDQIDARSGQGLSPFWLTTSEQEVPACGCPGTTTLTDQHVRARTHLRMASLTYMARFGLPIVAVSGLQTCDSCRFGRSLALPLHVCSGSLFKGSLTLLSPGRRSWGRVLRARPYIPPDTCRTRRTSRHRDPISGRRGRAPLELDGWSRGLGSSHGDCERLPRLPSTATGQGRLQCNGPGIEVRNSKTHVCNTCLRTERLQRHLMDDICSTRNAHALSMNLTQIFQMEISKQLSMPSLEHVLLPWLRVCI